jgi:hypothetical protein
MRCYYKSGGSVKKSPAWTRKEGKSESGGLNAKGVASYRKANPGSKGLESCEPQEIVLCPYAGHEEKKH